MNKLLLSLPFSVLLSCAATAAPVVELFTSQGCYSCPPADEYLADIIENQPDVIALEFHVDYWDQLRYGSAGVWKDPFSDPAYTARQRRYNALDLEGKRGVYTPQMIVNGKVAQVGTSRARVQRALDSKQPEVDIKASYADEKLTVDIKGKRNSGAMLWLALFDRVQITDVPTGENHGKTMVNHHVVRQLVPLGQWQGDDVSQTFQVAAGLHSLGGDSAGCAVFLQDENLGPIRGAAYCN